MPKVNPEAGLWEAGWSPYGDLKWIFGPDPFIFEGSSNFTSDMEDSSDFTSDLGRRASWRKIGSSVTGNGPPSHWRI